MSIEQLLRSDFIQTPVHPRSRDWLPVEKEMTARELHGPIHQFKVLLFLLVAEHLETNHGFVNVTNNLDAKNINKLNRKSS